MYRTILELVTIIIRSIKQIMSYFNLQKISRRNDPKPSPEF